MESGRRRIRSTRTVFAVLETLRERDGAGVTEVAETLDLSKSTAHRHLATLQDLEYVVRDGDEYDVGFRFLRIGEHTRWRREAFGLVEEKVRKLAEETDERTQFLAEEHGQAVYLFRATGEHAVHTDSGIGKRVPLHATAAGKAILANVPDERVREILDRRGLPPITGETIVDEDRLRAELETIREQGYSLNDQENTPGLRAVGVPVTDGRGSVLGAISVSGPTHRMKGNLLTDTIPGLLLGTANELELNIQYA